MRGAGFEPARVSTVELKSTPLDHSGILPKIFLKYFWGELIINHNLTNHCVSKNINTSDKLYNNIIYP